MENRRAIDWSLQAMTVQLNDRYTRRDGSILITGVQALVRLMILQAERDKAAGIKSGGFVSGYRGSPLGTLDTAFQGARDSMAGLDIKVMPAVNEELGATAIAGTQQIEQSPGARVQGVYSLWYGKGPGFDRASDAIRHGNYQGSSPFGGVVLAVGDDHLAKSSSIICYSDDTVASVQVPLFYPADPREIVEFGLHGFACSRHTGSWIALKILTEVADSTRAVDGSELADDPVLPPVVAPPGGLHNRWPMTPQDQEMLQQAYRLPAVLEYVRANRLDRSILRDDGSRIGIVAAGKSWLDVREAMRLLGLDEAAQRKLGIAFYKPALIWPLEPEGMRTFALGLEQLVVVEEKTGLIEQQAKAICYGRDGAPEIVGKRHSDGTVLFPTTLDLTPEKIACELGRLLGALGAGLEDRVDELAGLLAAQAEFAIPPAIRKPFFCSGCPHNRSTVVPEGSRGTAGIGCHGLAAYNRPRTTSFAQMGGEGVHWVGLSQFTDEKHMFANMGDGTYFHSGLLAIRQAVAANINLTLKILYNSAVAMTGGQAVDGELSVAQLLQQLRAEGVKTIIVSTDDPDRYTAGDPVRGLADRIEHRDDLDAVQLELRDTPGVSVLVYEQMCATEKRRLRKRGKLAEPAQRVFINELVCEGCGDCSAKSNCLSVEPVQTGFGTKRRINQSSCNKDFSCLNGFCPSFVTVEGGQVRKPKAIAPIPDLPLLVEPGIPMPAHQRLLVAGVGGTGVVTIGALLSMAGHMGGRKVAVLDQVGMAQKGGAVTSHVHIGGDEITALRIPPGEADLVVVCDEIVGNARDVIAAINPVSTNVLVNSDVAITGDFTQDPSAIPDGTFLARRIAKVAGEGRFVAFPFTRLAERLLGDAIGSNLMMVGFAFQKGWMVLDLTDFAAAVQLNGVGVGMNMAAFEWGRRLAVDTASVLRAAGLGEPEPEVPEQVVEQRALFLTDYQDRSYADRYRALIAKVAAKDQELGGDGSLTIAAARSLFKLMAYKDEYEVARLQHSAAFDDSLKTQFDGDYKLYFHLAPPLFARRDKATGHLRKARFGPWMMHAFGLLARLKGLRGTALDPFGRTAERRMERALIVEYEKLLDAMMRRVGLDNLAAITEVLALPMTIRGFGHVKEAAVAAYRSRLAAALDELDSQSGPLNMSQVA
ncbi:indolepyruvate ferredoxin oxidoreductase family protein [Altererythrobacter salegens]|uniref:Indolepyruvate ferredoxin oxidoreductase family protein n=1 Tax=Croceibacterium salegens TaxID=1737568 RepID=A0A6I4SXS2_9SPHN|nr:indolepyruvate ferredoxin oxidoreductase family protein [Croceibacterium salegens]MXO60653.1 indolepyruvate ferredoxin oxidoreductase family protein [Croceibacterium salegens]